jgi:anti-sigma B factor antagonist
MSFGIQSEHCGTLPLFRVTGELDVFTAPRLLDVVDEALTNGADSIAFDFTCLTFMDGSGLRVLVSTKRQASERGGQVYVIGINGAVRRMFNIIQVGDQFRLCTEAELPAA